ncbi:ABC transporter permease [Castellaniella sp. MT123]|uniref:ABC transporter permease n=1 Tax=Castellaniella sp. MT123 TaxID=3140381 RepID=UPI0031F42089
MTALSVVAGLQDRFGEYVLKLFSWMVLLFLILPVLVIIPLSFNAEPFFTFTPSMLRLDPDAYSLKWYAAIFESQNWILAIKNSFFIGIVSTLLATVLGTVAAVGLAREDMPFRRFITAAILSPMIVPLIIVAAGMFFFYSRFDLVATYTGIIIAHTALGAPFVVITVTASLQGFDQSLYKAGLSLGAPPLKVYRDVVLPVIRPGLISGALFAFVTSFDEIVLVLFLAGPQQQTVPRQMFSGLRESISPTILAVATLLIITSVIFLVSLEFLRRRAEHAKTSGRGDE